MADDKNQAKTINLEAEASAFKTEKLTFQEYTDAIGKNIDTLILKYEEEKKLHFVGGTTVFRIKGLFSKRCSQETQLYFTDENKEWVNVNISGKLSLAHFTDDAVSGELADIAKNKELKYEIVHP